MVLVEARAKRWGNSLGVIIPKDIVEQEHIHEDERIALGQGQPAGLEGDIRNVQEPHQETDIADHGGDTQGTL